MIYILDRNYKVYRILDIDYKFIKEMNKLNILEFTTDFEIPKGDYVVLKDDGKYYEFVVVDSDYSREDNYSLDYYCQDTLLESNGFVIEDKKPNRNVIQHLEIIFSDTGWEIVNKGDFTTNEVQINYYRISVLEAFKKVLETFEIEWETNFIVDNGVITRRQLIIGKVGKRVNSRLEFEKNIKRFERKILPEPVYTALIGLGKGEEKVDEEGNSTGGYGRKITFADVNNGSWYIGDEEARLKYGIGKKGNKKHYFGFVTFSDETDKNKLLERTKEELKKVSRPQAEYTIDVANINIDVNLGDEVPAIDEVLGFRDYLKVVKVEKTKLSTELTFGVMTRAFSSLSDVNGESITEKVTEIVSSRFSEELNRVVNNFNNEDGYNYDLKAGNKYNLPAGYYSFNKPIDENPTKVTYLGAGKVLIADEKGSDGSWKWKTALDGNGIYGSEIVTHSITANKLAADVGQSLDLSSNTSIKLQVTNATQEYIDANKDQLKGKDGKDGVDGKDGYTPIKGVDYFDGKSQYVHIKYSANSTGSSFTDKPTSSTKYIGIANTTSATAPTSANAYTWSKYRGEDGADGQQGQPGAPGKDGQPTYTWVKYADTPTSGMSDFPEGKKYIGLAFNKTTPTESGKYSDYQWSLMPQNIEVGGRNLLRNSGNEVTQRGSKRIFSNLVVGEEYTFQVEYEIVEGTPSSFLLYLNGTGNYWVQAPINDTPIGKTKVTFIPPNENVVPNLNLYTGYNAAESRTVTVKFKNMKLERGNIATDWTPAPEDMATSESLREISEIYDGEVSGIIGELAKQGEELDKKASEAGLEEVKNELTQKIEFNSLQITQTSDSFTQEYTRIEGLIQNNQVELEKLTGVIQSGLDENGNTYTDWIGNDENRVRVGSDGIVMLSNNAETLKLKDGRGYMNSLYVEHELGLGNHTARKMGTEFTVFMPIGGQNELDS